MKLTPEEVKYLENLAKITLTDEKKEQFANEIGEVLGYVSEIKNFDTSSVSDSTVENGITKSNYREDSIIGKTENHKEKALKNAPNHESDYFKVSKVIKN